MGNDLDIGTGSFAQLRDLVDEGDAGGQEAVGGVLDPLRGLDVGDHDRHATGAEWRVDIEHDVGGALVAAADDQAVRAHEVLDGRALAQELGVADHGERVPAADDLFDHSAGADRHGALGDDCLVAVEPSTDCLSHLAHVAEIGRAVLAGRRADGDEDSRRGFKSRPQVGRETQASGFLVLGDQGRQARLVDWNPARLQLGDLRLILVDADDVHAEVGEACTRDQADVAGADDADSHARLLYNSG